MCTKSHRPQRSWDGNIKTDLKEVDRDSMVWILLSQDQGPANRMMDVGVS
jgi:hypothetical protein